MPMESTNLGPRGLTETEITSIGRAGAGPKPPSQRNVQKRKFILAKHSGLVHLDNSFLWRTPCEVTSGHDLHMGCCGHMLQDRY